MNSYVDDWFSERDQKRQAEENEALVKAFHRQEILDNSCLDDIPLDRRNDFIESDFEANAEEYYARFFGDAPHDSDDESEGF